MRAKGPMLLFMIGILALVCNLAAQTPGQAGQAVQITNGPTIERANSNSAIIAWSTNQPSSSRVWYGTDKDNLTQLAEAPFSSGDTHRVEIKNLKPNTTYYFQLESQRGLSEAEGKGVMSFRTPAQGQAPITNQNAQLAEKEAFETGKVKITNGPVLEEVTSNSATVAWSTNLKGSTRVNYGTDPNNLTQLGEAPWGAGGLTHRVEIKNLLPNTTYYFRVETGQAQGTGGAEVESQKVMSFKTPAAGAQPVRNQRPR